MSNLPDHEPRRGSYLWLVKIGAAPPFHGTAAELAELDWSISVLPRLMSAVGHLARRGELDPSEFDPETARALRCCVLWGWATETGGGRLRVTDAGRREHELERLESYA